MIDIRTLEVAGYMSFPPRREFATAAYQKVWASFGGPKMFFLNIFFLEDDQESPPQIRAEVQFYVALPGEGSYNTFDVSMNIRATQNLADIERFFMNMYSQLGCLPDQDNN